MKLKRDSQIRIEIKVRMFRGAHYVKGRGNSKTLSVYETTIDEVMDIIEKAITKKLSYK